MLPHLANTIEAEPSWPSPHPKWHLDQFSRFCTVHRKVSLYFTMGSPFPASKLPLSIGHLDANLMHGSLGIRSPQTTRHLDQLIRFYH